MSEQDTTVIDALRQAYADVDNAAAPISLDELTCSSHTVGTPLNAQMFRRRRWTVAAAASILLIGSIGTILALERAGEPAQLNPASDVILDDVPISSTPPSATTSGPAQQSVPDAVTNPTDVDASNLSIVDQVAALDPWKAAKLFRLDAQYSASPEQEADLVIANELNSRACYERLGVELTEFDTGRLQAWAAHRRTEWDGTRSFWTPAGRARHRSEGISAYRQQDGPVASPHVSRTEPTPPECYPAATGITHLGGTEVWSETRLARSLTENDSAWSQPGTLFGRLDGTFDAKQAADVCIADRGWDDWPANQGRYSEWYFQPAASEEEIDLVNDIVDCYEAVDAATIYLEAAAQHVAEFRAAFADDLELIESERTQALDDAYAVLIAAGLDPLSN